MSFWESFTTLFFQRKFVVHRALGLVFLLMWASAIGLYLYDWEAYARSHFVWLVPTLGFVQSITAMLTFTFLPRKKEPGIAYFSDKSTLSYGFICENSFFEMLLLFQNLYFSDALRPYIAAAPFVEDAFVFFPYFMRTLWPKTRMRDAQANENNKSDKNRFFYSINVLVIKVFYLFAKHYIGYFLNYARFLDRVHGDDKLRIYGLMLCSSFSATIAIFLHTLKFKGHIGPRFASYLYEASYIVTFYYYYRWSRFIVGSSDLALLVLLGVLVNIGPMWGQYAYQIPVFLLLTAMRAAPDASMNDTIVSFTGVDLAHAADGLRTQLAN